MNNLPQEIVHKISSYLDRGSLKSTLFLSHQFQYAAEEYSGAFSKYTLTERNVDRFLRIYGGRRFLHYLRTVELRTSVPALHGDRDECRDSPEELREMDEVFTRQIRCLFYAIRECEVQAAAVNRFGPGNIELVIYTPTIPIDRARYCTHRVFSSWRVHLLAVDSLPTLESVHSLNVEIGFDTFYHGFEPKPPLRKLDLRVLLDIADKLPNLNILKCSIGGDEWAHGLKSEDARYTTQDWAGPRRDSRHDFANAYNSITLPKLRHARLDFIYPLESVDMIDQRLAMPDLTRSIGHDTFSTSLRLLSCQLSTMILRVVADGSLFWPTYGAQPVWPNLEKLSIMFYIASPCGSWYFQGLFQEGEHEGFEVTSESYPPLETTEEDEETELDFEEFNWDEQLTWAQYRVVPNDETLVPFLSAFARAAASMPALKQAALWAPLQFHNAWEEYNELDANTVSKFTEDRLAWGLKYVSPHTRAFPNDPREDFSPFRQMWWHVAKWRPDAILLGLFRRIGWVEHGMDMVMHWEDPWCESGLVTRDYFEAWESQVFHGIL